MEIYFALLRHEEQKTQEEETINAFAPFAML
jgi:hypothetical protein